MLYRSLLPHIHMQISLKLPQWQANISTVKNLYLLMWQDAGRLNMSGNLVNGKLSIVIGFQIRYATPYVEMVKRIQRGDLGEILNVHLCYLATESAVGNITGLSYDEATDPQSIQFSCIVRRCYA